MYENRSDQQYKREKHEIEHSIRSEMVNEISMRRFHMI